MVLYKVLKFVIIAAYAKYVRMYYDYILKVLSSRELWPRKNLVTTMSIYIAMNFVNTPTETALLQ